MSPWEPGPRLLGNLYTIILGTLTTFTWKTWEPCREPWGNLLGTFWEPWGNLEEPWGNLGNLGNLDLGTLGTFTWERGDLYLGTFTWEPGNLYLGPWEPLLGNLGTFTWEPLLGNLYLGPWEPLLGNLGTFTWNLGTLGEWVLELLRSAPKPLLWLKTPKHSAVGEKHSVSRLSYFFAHLHLLSSDSFSSLIFSLLLSSSLWPFPSLLFICPYCRKFDF